MHKTQTLNDSIFKHCNQSMDNALLAERYPLWKRLCPELKDVDFIHLGLLRCIGQADSGRHFLRSANTPYWRLMDTSLIMPVILKKARMARSMQRVLSIV